MRVTRDKCLSLTYFELMRESAIYCCFMKKFMPVRVGFTLSAKNTYVSDRVLVKNSTNRLMEINGLNS